MLPARPQEKDDVPEIEMCSLKPYFLWTDTLALRYGEFSRSASIRIQLWGALAVFSSLLTIPLTITRSFCATSRAWN